MLGWLSIVRLRSVGAVLSVEKVLNGELSGVAQVSHRMPPLLRKVYGKVLLVGALV